MMLRAFALSLAILWGIPFQGTAAEPPQQVKGKFSPQVKYFAEACDVARQAAIYRLEQSLHGMEKAGAGLDTAKGIHSRGMAQRIQEIQEDLVELRGGRRFVTPTMAMPAKVGSIGRLPGGGAHVDQVLSANQMLGTCYFTTSQIKEDQSGVHLKRVSRSDETLR
jgi:hypothetical protein